MDGTLLDSDGTLRPRTADAVARAARAGIRPVLCTGRRYRRAQPIAHQLGIDAPLVCNSGAIIKDPRSHRTLWRADFDPTLADDVLRLFDDHDQPAVVFTDRDPVESDFIIAAYPTGRDFFDDYVGQNREHAEIRTNFRQDTPAAGGRALSFAAGDPLFHVCAIGSESEMLAFQEVAHERVGGPRSDLRAAQSHDIWGRCANSCAMMPANGPRSSTWRAYGESSRARSVPSATTSTTSR